MGGMQWEQLSSRQVFAVIWKMFADECHRKGHDPEDILREWEQQSKVLSSGRSGDVKWDDADRRALANLAKELG